MVSNRARDIKQEAVISDFLFRYFFTKVFEKVEKVNDKERQLQGIDFIADGKLIDVKAQSSARYLNNPTNTFILELSFLSRDYEETVGWFLNPNLLTNTYAFVWIPRARDVGGVLPNSNAIDEVEILLVDKQLLKIAVNNWRSDEDLLGISHYLRVKGITKKECTLEGVHLSHTPSLFEKPTNIVAQKEFLKQYSIGHYIVTKTSIQKID